MKFKAFDSDISVVVICFNQAGYIEDAIESVRSQTDPKAIKEIIVVDDASSDDSREVLNALASRDNRIKLKLRKTNSGGAATPRNDGLRLATGTHIAFLDGDDIWLSDRLTKTLSTLSQHPDAGLVYGDFAEFSTYPETSQRRFCNRLLSNQSNQLERLFVHGGPILPSTATVSRQVVDLSGYMDPTLKYNEESEFWMRLLMVTKAHHIPHPLVLKRQVNGSLGSSQFALENLECKRTITEMMVSREPKLRPLVRQREANIELKLGVYWLEQQDIYNARRHFVRALKLRPFQAKSLLYFGLTAFGRNPKNAIESLRRIRATVKSSLHKVFPKLHRDT